MTDPTEALAPNDLLLFHEAEAERDRLRAWRMAAVILPSRHCQHCGKATHWRVVVIKAGWQATDER